MEGVNFGSAVKKTLVNGQLVYDDGRFDEAIKGKRLMFNR
jgi:dihydroorotase